MNISQYNQSLNQAMPWVNNLANIDVKELEQMTKDAEWDKNEPRCDTYEEEYGY